MRRSAARGVAARWLLGIGHMTLKKMFMLGGVLAGAAYLQNKSRRDRLISQGRDLLDRAKTRASDVAHKVETRAHDVIDAARSDNGVGSSVGTSSASSYGGYGAGSTTYRTR